MAVVIDFLILTARVFGYVLQALLWWIKKPVEKIVKNEICLITGTASTTGIGRLLALEFARRGATLILWDTDTKGNENTAREVRKLGAKAYAYTCDVSQRDLVYAAAASVRKEVGEVSIVVNNAGIVAGMPILQCPDGQMERTMRTNCHAHFWVGTIACNKIEEGESSFLVALEKNTQSNGFKLQKKRFHLKIRKNFLRVRTVW